MALPLQRKNRNGFNVYRRCHTSGPLPAAFNTEAIAILREMYSNQNKTNEKVETLALKVDELYNLDYEYDENNNFKDQQDLDLYEDPHDIGDVSSNHGSLSIHIDIVEGTPKQPIYNGI